MAGPLTSLKVLDFSTLLPGPFATMFLADMGADVLRIEAPNRPDIVALQPPFIADSKISAAHATLNRSKRSMLLNLKHPQGPDIVKRLVREHGYDIVIDQFRPGVLDRLGVGYETLRAENPRLIYCAITGYGQTGPMAPRAGHDMNYMALSGLMSYSGQDGPHPHAMQVADVGGGSFMALTGLLAAVIHRQQTGEGQFIDVAMLDGAMVWNAAVGAEYLAGGPLPTYESSLLNGGSHYYYYRTADGRYLSVSSLEPQFWQGFCEAIERPDLIERLTEPGPAMRAVRDEIADVIATRTLTAWQEVFSQYDVCVEPVLTLDETVENPQTTARGMVVEVPGPHGSVRQFANPIKFSATPPEYRHYGVQAGQHTDEVLAEMGYGAAEIQGLREAGVFG